jgi:hypothetical protein
MFNGCSTTKPVYIGNLTCNHSNDEIKSYIIQILLEDEYNIQSQTDNYISAIAQSDIWEQHRLWTGYDTYIQWNFSLKGGNIVATSQFIMNKTNAFGKQVDNDISSMGDDADAKFNRYWHIRRKLEKYCGNTMFVGQSSNKQEGPDVFGK